MHNIALICTIHEAKGMCNINELYKIIEKINPEIIFEEVSPSDFDNYYKNKTKTRLETDAIIKYLENHKCEHIPVDYDYTLPEFFLIHQKYMHRQIELRSYTYKNIIDYDSFYKEQYGFKYLNSIECIKLDDELDKEIETVLKQINKEELFKINKSWIDLMEKRENEMLKNIYNYSNEHHFDKGLFFIGSGHRRSIISKMQNYSMAEKTKITWNYDNYDGIL